MIRKTTKLQLTFVFFLIFCITSCSSSSSTEESTLTPVVIAKPSPSPHITVESTPNNLAKEPTRQPQPTVQILQGLVIAPTVDINTTNINLKQELYFTSGAENASGLPICTFWLFEKYEVSLESQYKFFEDGIVPVEVNSERVSPFILGTVDDELHLCIYDFPENEVVTVELYTPEGNLCTSWDVNVNDYYYLAVEDVTIVDFVTSWPRCSQAGQWFVIANSASANVKSFIEIAWEQMAKLKVSSLCDTANKYVSVEGVGYPPGETRFLGVYGARSDLGEIEIYGYGYTSELLQSYLIEIDNTGAFNVLLPLDLLGAYIVVPIMDESPDYGGHESLLSPGVALYPNTCGYAQDLYLTPPSLEYEDIKEIQQRLCELGYFEVGPVDGDFGTKTEAAVRLFQQTNALDANGIVDEVTRKVLLSEDAISRPLERKLYVTSPRLNGDDVVIVQQRLTDLGYVEVGEVDGYYGPLTESGVLRFQKMNKLPESGIVDAQNWNTIFGNNPVPGW